MLSRAFFTNFKEKTIMKDYVPKTKVGIVKGQLKVTAVYYSRKMAKLNNKEVGWKEVPEVECSPKCRGVLSDGGNEICIGGECVIIPVG